MLERIAGGGCQSARTGDGCDYHVGCVVRKGGDGLAMIVYLSLAKISLRPDRVATPAFRRSPPHFTWLKTHKRRDGVDEPRIAGTMQYHDPRHEQDSPLLRLPIELRRLIYLHVLPSTSAVDVPQQRGVGESGKIELNLTFVRQTGTWNLQQTNPKTHRETGNDILWRRGCIGILSVNRKIHEECADMIYGDNTFVIDVTFNKIELRYRWLVETTGLTPSRAISFLHHFSQRNLLRIKNYIINVEHVDDYTGMIKYNCGARGLTAGIRQQVQTLIDLLSLVPHLNQLQIHLVDGDISRVRFPSGRLHRVQDTEYYKQSQTVLDPFHRLYGVRRAKITGVTDEYAEVLGKSMTASRSTAA